jgi:hypothetical protein
MQLRSLFSVLFLVTSVQGQVRRRLDKASVIVKPLWEKTSEVEDIIGLWESHWHISMFYSTDNGSQDRADKVTKVSGRKRVKGGNHSNKGNGGKGGHENTGDPSPSDSANQDANNLFFY